MKNKLKIVLLVAVCIVLLDQITKWMIVRWVPLGTEVPVIAGVFDIVHGRNTGAAFGMLHAWDSSFKNLLFYAIGIVAVIFLFNYIKTVAEKDRLSIDALGLILGGACGNVIDRIVRGSVVDFLSVHYHDVIWHFTFLGYRLTVPLIWPSFKVADAAISVAVVLLVIQNLKTAKKSGVRSQESGNKR